MSLIVEGKSKKVCQLDDDFLKIEYKNDVSCFNKYRCQIEGKGEILNSQNAWWMKKTEHIIRNHYLAHYDNILFVKKCKRIDIEVIVRNYYTGSLTKEGELEKYGLVFEKQLKEGDKFPYPIITPTTKDEFDSPLKEHEIIDKKLATLEDWEIIKDTALKLFEFGSSIMEDKGLILVDTKYEFGWDKGGNLTLIDEIHTTDSSRYWDILNKKSFDKDHLRRFVKENPDKEIPEEIKNKVLDSYHYIFDVLVNGLVVIISGSISDQPFVEKINQQLINNKINYVNYYHSAHKETLKVLEIINKYNQREDKIVFVTVAGLSNALGGVVASNSHKPVINCPPFKDETNMFLNINSSLMMPSKVPSATILRPDNLALFIKNIFNLY